MVVTVAVDIDIVIVKNRRTKHAHHLLHSAARDTILELGIVDRRMAVQWFNLVLSPKYIYQIPKFQ